MCDKRDKAEEKSHVTQTLTINGFLLNSKHILESTTSVFSDDTTW